MSKPIDHQAVTKWFFILLSLGGVLLFWKIIEPFAIVLMTAGVVAVLATPLEKRLRKLVKHPHLSGFLMLILVFVIVVGPLVTIALLMTEQALEIAQGTVANPAWADNLNLAGQPYFTALPTIIQERLLALDVPAVLNTVANWVFSHIGDAFASSANLIFKTFIFFICLYYFLVEREKIQTEFLALSPFKDRLDNDIMTRLVETVRGVVFGSLIVAVIQGVFAAIGLTIFGVPGALLWGALVVVTAQIPMLGTATVMAPAVFYMFFTGHPNAAIGLAIWSVVVVGSIDNVIAPRIVGGRTRMHSLLILLTMLGGLQFFGPIGFILGPTVLAALLVLLELYKAGILEKKTV